MNQSYITTGVAAPFQICTATMTSAGASAQMKIGAPYGGSLFSTGVFTRAAGESTQDVTLYGMLAPGGTYELLWNNAELVAWNYQPTT